MAREIVRITIPEFIPPTVNHYKKPVTFYTSNGPRKSYALTDEAEAWIQLTQIYSRGQTLVPEGATKQQLSKIRYTLHARVVFGKGQSGDGDNFWKCIADSLTKVGVIHSDARVKRWFIEVVDDERADGPRTEIRVALMRTPCPKPKLKTPKTPRPRRSAKATPA